MNSLDTNVLISALDEEAPGHDSAFALYRRLFNEPEGWVLADQVLFELYRALRNPKIFRSPLDPKTALEVVEELRNRSHARCAAYETRQWKELTRLLEQNAERKGLLVFDAVLAVTLKAAGVKRFYTRNVKDFEAFGCFEAVDPPDVPETG